jgi:hypothetical protein
MHNKSVRYLIFIVAATFLGLQSCSSAPAIQQQDQTVQSSSQSSSPTQSSPDPDQISADIPPTTVPSPTPFPSFQDDFNESLEDDWIWLEEVPSGWNLTDRKGFIKLDVVPGLDQRLVRKAPEGDFVITTRVLFHPVENFQSAGLIIYFGELQWLQFQRAMAYFPFDLPCCVGNGLYYDNIDVEQGLEENGYCIGPNFPTITDLVDEAYLRVIKDGTAFIAYYSEDGIEWDLIGTQEVEWLPTYIGIQTTGAELNPEDAYFDFFIVEDLSRYSNTVVAAEVPVQEGIRSGTDYSIFGNIQLSFVPYNDQAILPEAPVDLTLVIEPEEGGKAVRVPITDPQGGFGLALDPGNYVIASLEVDSPSISENIATLLSGMPRFTVIEGGCVYIGRIGISYYRFPPGDLLQQNEWISQLAAQVGREVYAIQFSSGSLVPESGNIDLPDENLWPDGAENCQIQGAQW